MRKTSAPGNVSGAYVDYDAVTNPSGTVINSAWLNDVQLELLGIQDDAGIAEAAGSFEYVLSAIKRIAISLGKPVGELFYLDKYQAPAAFDKDDPESFFPAFCLSTIETSEDLAAANYASLVTHLRAKAAYYAQGKTGEKSAFDVIGWAISSNVATLTFANTTAENALLAALAEDNLFHGSYGSWRTITLASAIGDIAAGDYTLTDVDTLARTVSFAYTAADNSASGTFTVNHYPHRIAGSTTTARVFEADGLVLATAGASGTIAGLRTRDQMQQLTGEWENISGGGGVGAIRSGGSATGVFTLGTAHTSALQNVTVASNAVAFDSSQSPNARTGTATRERRLGAHLYIWGRDYAV